MIHMLIAHDEGTGCTNSSKQHRERLRYLILRDFVNRSNEAVPGLGKIGAKFTKSAIEPIVPNENATEFSATNGAMPILLDNTALGLSAV